MTYKEDEKYITDQTTKIVHAVIAFLNTQEKAKGKETAEQISISFLASFIGAKVLLTLKDGIYATKTDQEKIDYIQNNFSGLKTNIQNAVAAGFQGGMKEFAGKDIEYYCQIRVVPPVANKILC